MAEKATKKTAKKPAKKAAKKKSSECQQLGCGEVMDITTVAEFKTVLVTALASKESVLLNGSQVERADTAALQLLSAFFQDANKQKKTVEWKDPSEALCRSATLLGLTEALNLQAQ